MKINKSQYNLMMYKTSGFKLFMPSHTVVSVEAFRSTFRAYTNKLVSSSPRRKTVSSLRRTFTSNRQISRPQKTVPKNTSVFLFPRGKSFSRVINATHNNCSVHPRTPAPHSIRRPRPRGVRRVSHNLKIRCESIFFPNPTNFFQPLHTLA